MVGNRAAVMARMKEVQEVGEYLEETSKWGEKEESEMPETLEARLMG